MGVKLTIWREKPTTSSHFIGNSTAILEPTSELQLKLYFFVYYQNWDRSKLVSRNFSGVE